MTSTDFFTLMGQPRVTFQTFLDKDGDGRGQILHGPLSAVQRKLTALNDAGHGIYWMVNQGDLRGRRTENVKAVTAYFIDLDGQALPTNYPLDPTAIVESSPGKYHVYWRVTNAPLETFSHVQKHLAVLFDSDPIVHDLPRVMRVPGFYHHKGEPFLSKIIHADESAVYTNAQIWHQFLPPEYVPLAKLSPAAESYCQKYQGKGSTQSRYKLLDKVAAAPQGTRNDTLYRNACALANDVAEGKLDRDTATEELLQASNMAGLGELEARKTIDSAMRYASA